MSKDLAIAHSFYRAGHKVIGADFEPYYILVRGSFSRSISRFYRVSKPKPAPKGAQRYIQDLVDIVKKEGVELWVCSGVASAIKDGEAKEVLEKVTGCKAVQFPVDVTARLHEKDSFIENTKRLGLNVPETISIRSEADAMTFSYEGKEGRKYILKATGMDDSIRADMSLLPLSTSEETRRHIASLKPSPSRPFVLQQFISGPEYCTHSIVIRGRIKAFTACRSLELLMQYRAMDPESPLFKTFLRYTEEYAEKMGEEFTGHFSIDFLVDGQGVDGREKGVDELMETIFPIECNPRAHTAAILFADKSEEIAAAYLSLLGEVGSENENKGIVIPSSDTPGYYWIGHDLITRLLLPVLYWLHGSMGTVGVLGSWIEFLDHLLFWKDGTYEIWDPWPMWWLYVVY